MNLSYSRTVSIGDRTITEAVHVDELPVGLLPVVDSPYSEQAAWLMMVKAALQSRENEES